MLTFSCLEVQFILTTPQHACVNGEPSPHHSLPQTALQKSLSAQNGACLVMVNGHHLPLQAEVKSFHKGHEERCYAQKTSNGLYHHPGKQSSGKSQDSSVPRKLKCRVLEKCLT